MIAELEMGEEPQSVAAKPSQRWKDQHVLRPAASLSKSVQPRSRRCDPAYISAPLAVSRSGLRASAVRRAAVEAQRTLEIIREGDSARPDHQIARKVIISTACDSPNLMSGTQEVLSERGDLPAVGDLDWPRLAVQVIVCKKYLRTRSCEFEVNALQGF